MLRISPMSSSPATCGVVIVSVSFCFAIQIPRYDRVSVTWAAGGSKFEPTLRIRLHQLALGFNRDVEQVMSAHFIRHVLIGIVHGVHHAVFAHDLLQK